MNKELIGRVAFSVGDYVLGSPPAEAAAAVPDSDVTFDVGRRIHQPRRYASPAPISPGPRRATVPSDDHLYHGGGFRAGSRAGLCQRPVYCLAQHGYVAADRTLYHPAPKYPVSPRPIYDTKEAVRWLHANAKKHNIDPGLPASPAARLAVIWPSSSAFDDGRRRGIRGRCRRQRGPVCRARCRVVNFYGPSDFTKSYGKSVQGRRRGAAAVPRRRTWKRHASSTSGSQSALLGDAASSAS